ncbi:MAG: dihydroorotase [Burkholderiaceae bacterium]
MNKLSITGGRLIDPATNFDQVADIHIADGKVVAIGNSPDGFVAEQIDASGRWVMPGLVDLAARLREPGLKYRANLESELGAAVAGGVTSLCMPPDTDPPLDEPGLVEMLDHRARQLHGTRLFPLGALTVGLRGEVITEMARLTAAGCVGLAQPNRLPVDTQTLLRALQYANTYDYTVWLHPQDAHIGRDGVAHGGAVASRLGLTTVPVSAETIALHIIFELVAQTGCRVHLCRLSSAAGLELVAQAKARGLPITCDVGVHYLHITELDIGHFDSRLRVDPPFRGLRDRDALRRGLADGTIDAICSDHTPVDDDSKQVPFAEAEPGASGLELLLPLVCKWASEDKVAPVQALASVTSRAAKILCQPLGSLQVGDIADVCIYQPDQAWTVTAEELRSRCHHTPFSDIEIHGRVTEVLIDGCRVNSPR